MRERRFRIWIDGFQSKLYWRIFAYGLIYQVSLWNFLFAWRLTSEGKGNLWEQYVHFFWDFYPMFFCFLLIVPFIAWDAVRFAHRLAGPIYRFRKTVQAVAGGDPV